MPAITTMLYPVPAYVRVEVNWADVGQATGAAVYRVDCLTGERVPLRPYVCFNGDFLTLSCGYGIFWDTEPQLDRCVYYCTQAIDAAGTVTTTAADPLLLDTFTRTVANGWGSADTGQSYTFVAGVAGDYSTNGTRGRILSSGTNRRAITAGGPWLNAQVEGTVYPTVVATGAPIDQGYALRMDTAGANTAYEGLVRFDTAGVLRVRINKSVSGSVTNLAEVTLATTYIATTGMRIKFQVWGSQLRLKAWDVTTPEPTDWQIDITDTSITTAGGYGAVIRVQAGNGNSPFTASWDDVLVTDPCVTLRTIEACSQDLVVPSSGDFRLGDPVRPCHDVTLLFEAPIDPDCVPTQGIFFGNMAEEGFTANTNTFVPVNAKYPIVVNRTRQAVQSVLTVASKTFPDRDAMRTLNEPGSPLLLRGPAEYGINDRYMSVKDVTETRPLPDHRITPRVITLPHAQVLRPSGPSTGVCGTRVEDLCDIYPTWDALIAAGLTFADLVRGRASNETPIPDVVERTWAQVNTTYADWNAVNAGNTDWDDLRDGA